MSRFTTLCAVVTSGMLMLGPSARAESPFGGLGGTWSGFGQIKLDGGATEKIKCNAYYTPKETSMGIALRCASASYKIELRSQLQYDGGRISGSWEERTFNAAGAVTGSANGNKISLSVTGGGMTGSMNVSTNGTSQSVAISTHGTGLQSVSINLSKG